jgi:hypothetical protein
MSIASKFLAIILFALALLSAWIGISYSNKCNAGLDDNKSASNKSFLISMTIMSVVIALYNIIPPPNNIYFLTLVMCAITIAASSIGIEFKKKCTDGLQDTSDTTLIIILVGSILTCLLTIWRQHKSAIKNASKLIKNKVQATKVTYNAQKRAKQIQKNMSAAAQANANAAASAKAQANANAAASAKAQATANTTAAAKKKLKNKYEIITKKNMHKYLLKHHPNKGGNGVGVANVLELTKEVGLR